MFEGYIEITKEAAQKRYDGSEGGVFFAPIGVNPDNVHYTFEHAIELLSIKPSTFEHALTIFQRYFPGKTRFYRIAL